MKFRDLLEATYIQDIKRSILSSLVALKIQGIHKIDTSQVLKDFAEHNMPISLADLISFLQDDPMISRVNKDFIEFAQDGDQEMTAKDNVDQDKEKVHQLSTKKLNKELK